MKGSLAPELSCESGSLLMQGSRQLDPSEDAGMTPAEEWRETEADVYCFGCLQPIVGLNQMDVDDPGVVAKCPDCLHVFCFDCDTYIHESLHNCPGCECLGSDEVNDS